MKRYMRKSLIIILFIILFTIFGAASANAENASYYLAIAFKNSPLLKSQMHRSDAAREFYLKESFFSRNPLFSASYSNVPISQWPALDKHPMSGISIGIAQYLATPWEAHYRKSAVYQAFLSEKESVEDARNMLALQVQSTYHHIFFLQRKKIILEKNLLTLNDILRVAESMVMVNRMSSTHLLKLRADRATLSTTIIEVEGAIAGAQSEMDKLCGKTLAWNIPAEEVNGWMQQKVPDTPADFNYTQHPHYRKMKILYEAQKATHQLEKAKLSPGVTLGFEYRIREEIPMRDDGEDFISFKASTPLPLFYPLTDRHRINAAADKERELKELLRKVQIELTTRWSGEKRNYLKLKDALSKFQNEVLPGYLAAYKGQLASLSAGNVNLLDVLDAYRRYLGASMDEARLHRDLMISALRLNYLLHHYPGRITHKKGERTDEKK